MAFRKDDAKKEGFDTAVDYLVPKGISADDRNKITDYIDDLTVKLGPAISEYPSWHPLVCHHDGTHPETYPSERCGYDGLDHTILFANGFITCPYHGSENVIASVDRLQDHEASVRYEHVARIVCEKPELPLYQPNTEPVLVICEWKRPIHVDKTIPKDLAVGLMLENEIPMWRWSKYGETWETMRGYLLGRPCGKRSSLSLDEEAGQAMKKVYTTVVYSGMFGSLKV